MARVGELVFSPWLSSKEREEVRAHSYENFEYAQYNIRDVSGKWYQTRLGKKRIFEGDFNIVTKEVMLPDHPSLIAFKCVFIIGLNIINATARALFHTARMPYLILGIALRTLKELANSVKSCRLTKAICIDLIQTGGSGSLKVLWEQSKEIVRTIYYSIGIEIAAIYGALFDPLRARAIIGRMEKKLNWEIEAKHSYQVQADLCKLDAHYLAICMQSLATEFTKQTVRDKDGNEYPKYHLISTEKDMGLETHFAQGALPCFRGCFFSLKV